VVLRRKNKSTRKGKPKVIAEQQGGDINPDAAGNAVEGKATTNTDTNKSKKPVASRVSESIREMTLSPAILPGESALPTNTERPMPDSIDAILTTCAKDIMQKDLLWGSPDDSVQHALEKTQQHNAGYMMIGQDGVLEGIVSRSDLKGTISPYLRPVFAKWRRPLDDATLQIKIKWIMTKIVHTITPETPLVETIENMHRFHVRGLPVAEAQGKVIGFVTVFDIFRILLTYKTDALAVSGSVQ